MYHTFSLKLFLKEILNNFSEKEVNKDHPLLLYFNIFVYPFRNIDSLVEQFKKRPKCFFILTNSRSLDSEKVENFLPTTALQSFYFNEKV